jgi:hypothetical protein
MHLKSIEIVGIRRNADQANRFFSCAVMLSQPGAADAV